MKHVVSGFLVIAALAAFLFITPPARAGEDKEDAPFKPGEVKSLKWVDFDRYFPKLEKKKKPALLYFYSPDCIDECKSYETALFADRKVKSKSGRFLCFMLDSNTHSDLAKKHGIDPGACGVALLDFQKKQLEKYASVPEAGDFADKLEECYKANRETLKLMKKIVKAYKYSQKLLRRGKTEQAYAIWEEIAKQADKVTSEEVNELVKKLENLKAEGMAMAKSLLRDAKNVATRHRNISAATTGLLLDRAAADTDKILKRAREYRVKYAFKDVIEKIKEAEKAISDLLYRIREAVKRQKEEEERQRQQQQQRQNR